MSAIDFSGKVAIVTGAARGLGRAYAELLARRGARVLVNDFGGGVDGSGGSATPADEVVASINAAGGAAVAHGGSVIDHSAEIVAAALDRFGRLDILVNNAGISGGGWFHEMPEADWRRMLDTHLEGTVRMARAAWPHLAASGAGRIVNSSSTASLGAPFTSHYSTAKSAMIGLTRSLAFEGQASGLLVNAVMPSAYTRLTAQIPDETLRSYLEEHFTPERVAAFVVWLLSSDITGALFSVGGGHAARIFTAVNEGAKVAEDTPEAWAAVSGQVLAEEGITLPASMLEELCRKLGTIDERGAALAAQMNTGAAWKPE